MEWHKESGFYHSADGQIHRVIVLKGHSENDYQI